MFFGNVPVFRIWIFHNYFLCSPLLSHFFFKRSMINHNNKMKNNMSICIYKYKRKYYISFNWVKGNGAGVSVLESELQWELTCGKPTGIPILQ